VSIAFGDTEAADAYASDGVADPHQVGNRLHEYRVELGALTGAVIDRYERLTLEARALVDALGAALVDLWHASHTPAVIAAAFHEVRRFLAGPDVVPAWEDLPADQRELAVDLLELIVSWLAREGTAT
jgi:hypothetical protein